MIEYTAFTSIRDNKTHRRGECNWDNFVELLRSLSKKPGYKPPKDCTDFRGSSPLITPAVFSKGSTRRNVNVLYWGEWACLDIDDYKGSPNRVLKIFADYEYVIYSTASSTPQKPKFRVVLRLTERVPAKSIRRFWYALSKEFNELADPQTKDLCRIFYIPGQFPGALNFFLTNKGKSLDPDELMSKYPNYMADRHGLSAELPEDVKIRLAEYAASKLTNTNYTWSSYRNCPFVNQRIVAEYKAISETGWYRKMYQIMLSIASRAILRGYPISPKQIASLCEEIDAETGRWYKNRGFEKEAATAIEYALRNSPPSLKK
jgi:hypothetical protein